MPITTFWGSLRGGCGKLGWLMKKMRKSYNQINLIVEASTRLRRIFGKTTADRLEDPISR